VTNAGPGTVNVGLKIGDTSRWITLPLGTRVSFTAPPGASLIFANIGPGAATVSATYP
jgi:hypothetical protein